MYSGVVLFWIVQFWNLTLDILPFSFTDLLNCFAQSQLTLSLGKAAVYFNNFSPADTTVPFSFHKFPTNIYFLPNQLPIRLLSIFTASRRILACFDCAETEKACEQPPKKNTLQSSPAANTTVPYFLGMYDEYLFFLQMGFQNVIFSSTKGTTLGAWLLK